MSTVSSQVGVALFFLTYFLSFYLSRFSFYINILNLGNSLLLSKKEVLATSKCFQVNNYTNNITTATPNPASAPATRKNGSIIVNYKHFYKYEE